MRAGTVRILPVAAVVAATATLTAASVLGIGFVTGKTAPLFLAVEGVCWTLFACAILLLLRVPRRAVTGVVLLGTLLLGAAGAVGPPTTSTDSARYSWDGIVQDAGISPYRYVPADDALASLRPEWLFPTATSTGECARSTSGPPAESTRRIGGTGTICTTINRPAVPTIYPPVAEALFALARLTVPDDVQYLPMQLLGLLAVLGTTVLLLRTLARTGRDPRWAAVYGWCPFVITEAVTNAHIDAWAAFFALGATVLISEGRRIRGGIVLGLAIATKFVPVLVVPPLARRRPWMLALTAVGTVALVYVPHLIAVGPSVIGYLPGYLNEEGYDSGTRSALLSAVLPDSASTVVAVALLAVLALLLLRRGDPADPWAAQTVMVGSALLLLSPAYGWYSLLLVPFIVMSGRWEWLTVVISLSLIGVQHDRATMRSILLVALAIVLLTAWVRRRLRPTNLGAG